LKKSKIIIYVIPKTLKNIFIEGSGALIGFFHVKHIIEEFKNIRSNGVLLDSKYRVLMDNLKKMATL
jgi:hypothetical protein